MKIGYFGNSFLRQIIEGYHCLIDNITNNNAQNNVIKEYLAVIQHIDDNKMTNIDDYDILQCDAVIYAQRLKWNEKEKNALHLNRSVINRMFDYKLQSNIKNCRDDSLVLQRRPRNKPLTRKPMSHLMT